ncbi:glutathione-specific gamma-glutamylcyclotransferase 1 [Phlebotomus argentipes]|uniref:glutathione-specific gamma-glutamylcyclotransferase 1 n=1 Tax=Phlebotomus argentipes TaxID=94469 RepID=UPI002892D378|nr:glutathione-specific gamma-glutamylcyclotransferase 1 [Phlebotomus argentipes]
MDNVENIFATDESPFEDYGINNNDPDEDIPSVWVFGYGSLCWNPGFEFTKCITGYIRGYVRRFWQGNTTQRGTTDKPGRVATLVENKEGITWGCAYKIAGPTALDYLKQRECKLGGYIVEYTKFFPRVASRDSAHSGEAFPVLLYIASDENDQWVGEEPVASLATHIVDARGSCGHNIEYLLRLATFMREELPHAHDDHLFELEEVVRQLMSHRQIKLSAVMGRTPQRIRRDSHEETRRPISFEFTSRVPETRLRCLNI